jgi:hypothetical protein
MITNDLMTDTRPKIIVFSHGIPGTKRAPGIFWFDIRTAPQFDHDRGRLVGNFNLSGLNELAESRPLLAAIAEWQDRTGQTQRTDDGEQLSWSVEEFFALL